MMRVPRILLWPVGPSIHLLLCMALVLRHVMALRAVRRVRARVGGTRCGYGWIYRYFGVRLQMRCSVMVILMSI